MKKISQLFLVILMALSCYLQSAAAGTRDAGIPSAVERLHQLFGTKNRTLSYRITHWFESDEVYKLEYVPTSDGVQLTFFENSKKTNSYLISADETQAKYLGAAWLKTGVDTYDWSQLYRIDHNLGILVSQNQDNPSYVGLYIVRAKNGGILPALSSGKTTFFELEKNYELIEMHEQDLRN
jgi:hypothetical protein